MATAKLLIKYVKSVSSTSLRVKVRVKNDISPDIWQDNLPIIPTDTLKLWYRVGDDPTDSTHTEVTAYKTTLYDNNKYKRMYYLITGLTAGVKYHFKATGLGVSSTRYYSTVVVGSPAITNENALFCVENENFEWEDFSDCIPVPDYKVNSTNITEEWEDANYNTHSSVVQTRIKGNVNLFFRDITRYNRFLICLKHCESLYGKGHIRLKVQINNELDDESETPIPNMEIGMFKIEWDPNWGRPFYGTSKDPGTISFNIEEIEE